MSAKEINLLPEKYRLRQASRRLVPLSLLVILGAGVVTAAFWALIHWGTADLDEQIAIATARQETKQTTTPSSPASVNLTDAKARVTLLNTLSKSEIDWNRATETAGKLIPQDIRLTTYSYTVGASGLVSLRLAGTAPSNVSFAVFMQSLNSKADLSAVKVDSYLYNPINGSVSFTITVQMQSTGLFFLAPTS